MENKKIAYIILSKNHRSDFKKGFLNKSLCLAGNVTDMPYAWKASDLMDERLQKRGIVVCLNGSGELCDKTSLSIEEICRKENISGICLGEAEIAENYFSLPVFNGSISAFKANAAKVFENETVLQLCGIVADDDTDYAYFDYLAPKVGSIYLYGQSRSVASETAARLFRNEGIAVHVCSEVRQLERCDKILVLSENAAAKSPFLQRCEKCTNMFDAASLRFRGYTDMLGELDLNASYMDALKFFS